MNISAKYIASTQIYKNNANVIPITMIRDSVKIGLIDIHQTSRRRVHHHSDVPFLDIQQMVELDLNLMFRVVTA